jgi:hypothetical protein
LPTFLVGPDIGAGRLMTVLDRFPQPDFGVHALYASNRYLAAKTRAFVDFLAKRFGEEPEWDRFRTAGGGDGGPGRAPVVADKGRHSGGPP